MASFDIKIKGERDLLRVDDGFILKERWEKFLVDGVDEAVKVDNWTGYLSEFRSFRKVPELRSDGTSAEQTHKEYLVELKKIRSESPDKRAKRLSFFRLIYWGFTSKKSEEVMIKEKSIESLAEKIQEKFFAENPKRIVCDPLLFKGLIKSGKCNPAVLSIVESLFIQDRFAEKNL